MPHLSTEESARIDALIEVFTRIGDERMRDLSLYNARLRVDALGFRPWTDRSGHKWLAGILVTPWFMNFMLLPSDPALLAGEQVASKRRVDMPKGEIIFTLGEVEEFGRYLAHSLHSPMGNFTDQIMVETAGWAAVEGFFKEPETA